MCIGLYEYVSVLPVLVASVYEGGSTHQKISGESDSCRELRILKTRSDICPKLGISDISLIFAILILLK